MILSNTPHHVVQRRHDRKAVFIERGDCQVLPRHSLRVEIKTRLYGECTLPYNNLFVANSF